MKPEDAFVVLFKSFGLWGAIFLFLFAGLLYGAFHYFKERDKRNYEEQIRQKVRKENEEDKRKEREAAIEVERLKTPFQPVRDPYGILNHVIFINLDEYINSRIFSLVINERLRSAIYIDFLGLKFGAIHKEFYEFFERGDINRISREEFKRKFLEVIVNTISVYEGRAMINGIPHVAITRFNAWHHKTVQHIMDEIKRLCASDPKRKNDEIAVDILDVIDKTLSITLEECQTALKSLNGQLDMVEYKGIVSDNVLKREVKGMTHD